MRILRGLALVTALMILLSLGIFADDTICDRGDCDSGGAPAQSSTTLTFPFNTLAEIAATLLGNPLHMAVSLAIPDLEITFRKAITGNPDPWVDCGEPCCDSGGPLRLWADLVMHGGAAASDPFANALSATLRLSGSAVEDDSSNDVERLPCYIRQFVHIKNGTASAALVFAGGIQLPLSRSDSVEVAPGIEFEIQSNCGVRGNRSPDIGVPPLPVKIPVGGAVEVAISAIDADGDDVHVWVHGADGTEATLYYSEQTKQPMVRIELDDSVQGGTLLSISVDAYDLLADVSTPLSGRLSPSDRGSLYAHHVANVFEVEAVESEAPTTPVVSVQYPRIMREAQIDLTITNPGVMITDIAWYDLPAWAKLPTTYPCDDLSAWWDCVGRVREHIDSFSTWVKVFPEKMEIGAHSLSYQVLNLWGLRSIGIINIDILNSPPTAGDDLYSALCPSTPCSGTIHGAVLGNDKDPDGHSMTVSLEGSEPACGVLDLEPDGSFIYEIDLACTSEHDGGGVQTFNYKVSDGHGGEDTATVTIEIREAVSGPPVIGIHQLEDTSCPDPFGAGDDCQRFLVEISDPDLGGFWLYEKVTLTTIAGDGATALFSGFGESEWRSSVSIDNPELTTGVLAVKLDRTFAKSEITVLATDGESEDSAILRFTGNESPQVSFDSGETWEEVGVAEFDGMISSLDPLRLTMDPAWYEAGCLQFRDLDGDVLTFRMTQFPRFGTANLSTTGSNGNYFVTVMYEIDRDEMLACHRDRRDLVDQLTVQAKDPYGGVSEATMNIRFDVVNSPPVCENDLAVTPSGVPVTIDVLANDSDPDEDTLTISEVATPAGGGATVVGGEVVYTPDPGICGTDTFSYTVDDGYEGQTTAWISVEVTDNVDPVAACQPTTLYLDANGQATLDPASLDGGSTDNCSIAGFDTSQKTFDCSDLGDVPVLFTVFDGAGNSDTCWTTVTVVDDIDPVAVGQDLTVQLDASGQVTVLATQLDNGSADNCGIVSYLIGSVPTMTFTCAHRGINLVAFNVIDASGNSSSMNVSVTVEDILPPTAVCQDITASLDANGQVTVAASAVDDGSSDNCGIASMTLDRDAFTEADIGDQSVTLTVTDTSGNTDTCTAVVTVQDDTSPLITCPADVDEQADPGHCYATGVTLGTPTATDNTDVDWTTLTNNAPTQFPVGTTNVIWSVDDIYGNTGSCTQRVRVTEPVDPTVSCPSDIEVFTHDESGAVVTFSATASDNCDPSPQVSCSPSSGTTFPTGDTLVTCTATDDSGNTDTCTFTVTVVFQNDPPVALDDSGTVPEGGGCITISVLANDSDPDTDALTVFSVGTPQCGTTAITNGGTTIRYCTEGCSDPPDEITFSYTITDGYNGFDSATVTVEMPDGPIIFITPPPPEDE